VRHLTLHEVLELHRRVIARTGGTFGVHNLGALLSAVAQPQMTFEEQELYPSLVDKVSAFGYSLIMNHPFIEANERTGPAAMETLLVLNGYEMDADVEDQEKIFLQLSSGDLSREQLTDWLRTHVKGREENAIGLND
jgi:death-on-curing protein